MTSRDNVNPIATVIIKALDGQGDTVDQYDVTGRQEPALQLLDFMMMCEAMWGRHGSKIKRFACEISYVLFCVAFLSSAALAKPEVYDVVPTRVISSGDAFSGARQLLVPDRIRNVPMPLPTPKGSTFQRNQRPVEYYEYSWPPFKTETKRPLFDNVQKVLHQAEFNPRWMKMTAIIGTVLAGSLLIAFALGYNRFRFYK